MKQSTTQRGFELGEFTDRNDKKCSLQESSLATENCIWFGIDNPRVMISIYGKGWFDVPLPDDVLIESRMHLTQEQVKKLLPYLQRFVETGYLFDD